MKVHQLFESFATEDEAPTEQLLRQIKKDCSAFFMQCGNLPVWRGISHNDSTRGTTFGSRNLYLPSRKMPIRCSIDLVPVRKRRTPMSTDIAIHHAVDEFFEMEFNTKFRSESMFATGNRDQASGYGSGGGPSIVFPVGDFEFVWSPVIEDFYGDIVVSTPNFADPAIKKGLIKLYREMGWLKPNASSRDFDEVHHDKFITSSVKEKAELVKTLLENNPHWYKNTNLAEAIESGHEIMFACDEYYAIQCPESEAQIIMDMILKA